MNPQVAILILNWNGWCDIDMPQSPPYIITSTVSELVRGYPFVVQAPPARRLVAV